MEECFGCNDAEGCTKFRTRFGMDWTPLSLTSLLLAASRDSFSFFFRLGRLVYFLNYFSSMTLASVLCLNLFAQESDRPMEGQEAADTMIVPEGFRVQLFAGEPDVKQPIGFCMDDRGRLWVAEAYNYPNHGTRPGDRIIILEDSDGDGCFDKRTLFYDQLNYVSGIEVGFGGVWVMSPPYFYFIPDRNHDDVPDEAPVLLLDGFGNHANSHNIANAFAWGPDGWLYGTHGRTNFSRIGKPGTPDSQRTQFDGGVYRYHPLRHQWEPFADGTTNPWGIDWNDVGDAFVSNCVNPHLFHIIQGAHYEPWRNRESSRYAYQRIDTIADHLHFLGSDNFHAGVGTREEDLLGGGHAHSGTMIYLGDNWPPAYRNGVYMNNIHGKRINHDLLVRKGSGYSASHAPDVLRSRDPWHMGVTLQYGPDGSVFLSDWSDTGECHSVTNTRRETGRIFKITYGNPAFSPVDLGKLGNQELVQLQLHPNDWHVRHARRILQERFSEGKGDIQTKEALLRMLSDHPEVPRRLRTLWALHAIEGLDEPVLQKLLTDSDEHIRGWAIRLLFDHHVPSNSVIESLEKLAITDSSPCVRLQIASALQRLPLDQRWLIAQQLIAHAEDALDPNLPLMYWYGIEPLVDEDIQRFVELGANSKISLIRNHVARRASSHPKARAGIEYLLRSLSNAKASSVQIDLLSGMRKGLEGRRSVDLPNNWETIYDKLESSSSTVVQQLTIELAIVFDDPTAISTLQNRVLDSRLPTEKRQQAIHALVTKKVKGLDEKLIKLVMDRDVQTEAILGLATYNHPQTDQILLENYDRLSVSVKQAVLQTLASKPTWSKKLLGEIESGRIPRSDLSAFTARQIQSLKDENLTKQLIRVWGDVRSSSEAKTRAIAGYRKHLTTELIERANPKKGRTLFDKTCANCHQLFDAGGKIGPNLTGSQRTNVDYLLENLVDPSASVGKDYQMEVLVTDDDRLVTGMVVEEDEQVVHVQTEKERLILSKSDLTSRTLSTASMMPDGLLQTKTMEEIRDLVAYLMSKHQVEPQ